MDMKGFIQEVDKYGFGVEFNTYIQHFQDMNATVTKNCFFLKVSQRGKLGVFFKTEGLVSNLDEELDELLARIRKESNNPIIAALTL